MPGPIPMPEPERPSRRACETAEAEHAAGPEDAAEVAGTAGPRALQAAERPEAAVAARRCQRRADSDARDERRDAAE